MLTGQYLVAYVTFDDCTPRQYAYGFLLYGGQITSKCEGILSGAVTKAENKKIGLGATLNGVSNGK